VTDVLQIDEQLAEFCGAFIGDGWIESRKSVLYIAGDRTEDKEYYDAYLAPLFSKVICHVSPQAFPYWNVYGIRCCKSALIQECINLGLQAGKKAYSAKIPDAIMLSENKDVRIAVLRGIFDTDGCFFCDISRSSSDSWRKTYHCRPEIHIVSCSKDLLFQMQNILINLGIGSKLSAHESAGHKHKRNVHTSYHLRIRKLDHVKRWFEIIGSNNPRHKTKYAMWQKFGFLPPRTNIFQRKAMLCGELNPYACY
jgi:hypothetical protein